MKDRTICPYCGIGCGLVVKDDRITPEDYITNKKIMCIKGAMLLETTKSGRILYPYIGNKEVDWSKAIDFASDKLRRIIRKNKDSLGIYIGAQIPTEDQYVAVKLGKGYIGTASFDSNVRLCMASAAHSLKFTFDDPSPTASFDEIDKAETFVLIGVNPASNYPVIWNRIISSKSKGKSKIILIDPVFNDSAQQSDIYVKIPPGKDILLLNCIANILIRRGIIKIKPEGFEEFKNTVMEYSPERISKLINISKQTINDIVSRIIETKTIFMWGMGVNQTARGVDTGILISTIAMLTGNIGKDGTGILPLTGQHNSMGAREAGTLAGMLPGLRYIKNENEVNEVEDFWNIPRYSIPRYYYTITEMYKLIEERKIKALWIIATNPVLSLPESTKFKDLLTYLDLVIVQDAYFTDTTKIADVILPAASWSERNGIHTSGDRTVGKLNKLFKSPGNSMPDWWIIENIGIRLGFPFNYKSCEDIFNEFKDITKNRMDDISSLTYNDLDNGFRWPANSSILMPKKFRTKAINYSENDIMEGNEFTIITGRTKGHWNTRSRSSKSWLLNMLSDDDYIFIGKEDCEKLGIDDNNIVEIVTGEGYFSIKVKCVNWLTSNIAFMPFHYGHANKIMDWKVDPDSKEPAFKQLKAVIRKVKY